VAEQAASAAPAEVTSALHIQCRRVKVCAQHVIAISFVTVGIWRQGEWSPRPD
jgi:hypothetical protein